MLIVNIATAPFFIDFVDVNLLTHFYRTAPNSHILPLRRFIENVVQSDLRSFFASTCFKVSCTTS